MARKADGSVWIQSRIDNSDAQKDLEKLQKSMVKTAEETAELQKKITENEQKGVFSAAELDAEKAKLQELKSQLEEIKRTAGKTPEGQALISDTKTAVSEQAERVRQLQSAYNKLENETERYKNKLAQAEQSLKEQEIKAGELTQEIINSRNAVSAFAPAIERANKKMDKLSRRMREVLKSALLFSVITKALTSFKEWARDIVMTSEEARTAIANLKGALLTLAQPVVNVIIPAFTALVNVITRVVAVAANLTAKLFGQTAEQSSKAAEALYDQAKAAKTAGKSLAAFDEINQLSSGGGGESAGGAGSAISGEEITPNFNFSELIQQKMSELEVYLSGALLAVGTILALSGVNLPLGISLMAAGAVGLGSALAVDWNTIPSNMKKALSNTLVALGDGMLAIGAILTMTGNLPLGIALMVAGAAGLVTAAALNWDAVKQALQGPLGALTAMAGATFLGLGVLIALSGNLGVGIGMMVAGAAALGLTAALNWDSIKQALQGPLGDVVAAASGALLALGLILALSGVGLHLGIALIAAGAAGLVTVTALNWNAVLDKLKGAWSNIKNWWNTSVKKYFTVAFWKEKFSSISTGLTAKIKDGINAAIALLNRFINWVNDKLNISWRGLNIAGKEIIPAGNMQLLKIPNIPALATGAVIPPNREFLAVLGDQRSGNNIEAPESLIRKIVREEAGGMNSELLEQILQAIKAGRVIQVDKRILGKTAAEGINDITRQTGKPVLLV